MSLQNIRQAAITRLETLLAGSGYKELHHVFNVEQNNERVLAKGYGVRWGEGVTGRGPTRKVALDKRLTVIFTNAISARHDDNFAPDVDALYAEIESVIASFFNDTFLGIPDQIRGIRSVNIAPPELLKSDTIVKIEVSFVVDLTINISYS